MNCGPLFDGLALRTVHRAREVAHLSGRVEGLRAEVAQVRQDLTRARLEAGRRDAEIADQAQRLVAMDRRQHVASVQLRQLTEQRAREMQERLRLAIALDDPDAMADRLDELADRVERATAERRNERDRLQAEAEAMATEGARLRDDLAEALHSLAAARAERDAELADPAQRLVAMDRRQRVAAVQLRRLTDQRAREMQERLRLAIALDDPDAMADRLDELADRVERATAEHHKERDRLQAEAEAMATEGARLRDDLAEALHSLAEARAERDAAQHWGTTREAKLMASTSWRVTAPLRAVSRAARRLRP